MFSRPYWSQRIEDAWDQAPIVWLSGVRRCGKTTLARGLGGQDTLYLACDLPSVAARVRDPEHFFHSCSAPRIVFDEIHQLDDPTRLLKIGADHFPHLRLLATGSSTLAAGHKFRDTLTGRKRTVHLTPWLLEELEVAGISLERRLVRGGIPPALLLDSTPAEMYREWLDSFFARDIQTLFGFRDYARFNALFEYVIRASGGSLETTKTARDLGIARATVESHLRALVTTHAATVVRPFHGGGRAELVKQPKVYAFDTGFVCFVRGWNEPREEERGILWEHIVLEQIQAYEPHQAVHYWRDTHGSEIDFVLPRQRDTVDVLECKWNPNHLNPRALQRFREHYPSGRNYVVTPAAAEPYPLRSGNLEWTVCAPAHFRGGAQARPAAP
ncbi:MAG: ATP-binding protein [Planctomycetes bacterium]|nr:ATP-binding protein [Planctomycetota bacterium]